MTKTKTTALADRMAAARAARAAKKAVEALKTVANTDVPETNLEPAPAPEAVSEAAAPVTATTMEKAAITTEAARAKKVAALRAAKIVGVDPQTDPQVLVRITKKGHGLVSMGEHIGGLGDLTYDHGEMPNLPKSMALELEERGFVEIQ